MQKKQILLILLSLTIASFGYSQTEEIEIPDSLSIPCRISIDTIDEFDSTHTIISEPLNIGYLVPTRNLAVGGDGEEVTEEAKLVFSYAESEKNIRSFFLTLAVVEHQFLNIENGFNVYFKLGNNKIVEVYNVPDRAELNRDIIMWTYQHTLVIPLEVFHILKNEKVEKIRIIYDGYKRTIGLDPEQQLALQKAVQCVEERLRSQTVQP